MRTRSARSGQADKSKKSAGPSSTPPHAADQQRPLRVPRSASRGLYRDWDHAASDAVAILRCAAGHDPHDRELSDLVGELATQSEAFRTRWAQHNIRFHNTGVKQLHHPIVGDLGLSFNRLDLTADHGMTIFTYIAEPGSRSEAALDLLGSWAATIDPAESARATDQS